MHNACAKKFLKILEIEVHTWKLNMLIDRVLFLIGIPSFFFFFFSFFFFLNSSTMQLLPLLTMQYSYFHYLQYNTATCTTCNTIQLITLLTIQYSDLHYLQYNTTTYPTYNAIQLLTLLTIQYSYLHYLGEGGGDGITQARI